MLIYFIKNNLRYIKRLFIVIFALCFLCPYAFSNEHAQRFRKHLPTNIKDFQQANCIQLSKNEKICCCINAEKGQFYLYWSNGKNEFFWPTTCTGGTKNFEALKADLDDDGKNELIVARLDSVSNGIGICLWTIYIFHYPIGKTPPLEFASEDYGPTAFKKINNSGYEILTTEWLMQSGSPEYQSNYFIGRWFLYDKGMLLLQSKKPILMRRNTYKFEDTRNNYSEFGTPEKSFPYCFPVYKWLNSSFAKKSKNEPFYLKDNFKLKSGIVQKAERVLEEDESKMIITIEFEKAEAFTYGRKEYSGTYYQNYFNRLGDQKTGKLYPFDYMPSNPNKWLKGKTVELREYVDDRVPGRDYGFRVLWIAD